MRPAFRRSSELVKIREPEREREKVKTKENYIKRRFVIFPQFMLLGIK